ncbi:MAG: ATP-binding protein, partial [Nitrospirota bacterium]
MPRLIDIPENLFPRKILSEITQYIDGPEIILLVGARQVGKTSVLYLLMDEFIKRGTPEKSILYFDLEDLNVLDIFNSGVKGFISYLSALGNDIKGRLYIFVDEIQYMDNPANFLKLIADHHKNLKLIVSGSSTLEIRQKFKDSLAGRKVVFEIYPLDFYEFLVFKKEKTLCDALLKSDIRHITQKTEAANIPARFFIDDMARYFNEYLIFGGYPRIVIEAGHDKKVSYLMDIYTSYVKKDIKDIMRIDNVTAFNNLLKALALQTGSLVNITELCGAVKLARETLERYLFLLENTFIIKTVTPFSSNPRKEISKMSKVYFVDTGLRNIVIRNFNNPDERSDIGALVENCVCCNLIKNLAPLEEIHFWRTLAKNEVDFVLVKGEKISPVEVKYTAFKSSRVPLGIRYFQKDYESDEGVVLTKDYFGKAERAIFLPAWLC